jgi:GNAT superfamily N-acetyltransferase
MDGLALRRGIPDDAPEIVRTLELGFDGYRSFAPPSWNPPEFEEERLRARLEDDLVWCLVALDGEDMAGHVSFMPAALHDMWPDEDNPRLAHFWQLFVREPYWGTGLAADLHAAALAEAAARGMKTMRLHTPAAQGRARAFYEREGWRLTREPFLEESFGMPLVEYRIALIAPADRTR